MLSPLKPSEAVPHRELPPVHVETVIDSRPPQSPKQEMTTIRKLLSEVRVRSAELSEAEQQQQSRGAVLRDTKSRLTMDVEKQRKALQEAEEAVRRYQQDQERAAQRLAKLRAEAAELERKASALRADVADARRSAAALESKRGRAIQFVECVSDGVILRPQLTHIACQGLEQWGVGRACQERKACTSWSGPTASIASIGRETSPLSLVG